MAKEEKYCNMKECGGLSAHQKGKGARKLNWHLEQGSLDQVVRARSFKTQQRSTIEWILAREA